MWTKDPSAEKLATFDIYVNDPEVRKRAWQSRLRSADLGRRPNAGHLALVEFERRGVLDLLVTQNIDGLHLIAGPRPGEGRRDPRNDALDRLLSCGNRLPTPQVLERVTQAGEVDPACRSRCSSDGVDCGGILKSDTISFGQDLVAEDLRRRRARLRGLAT